MYTLLISQFRLIFALFSPYFPLNFPLIIDNHLHDEIESSRVQACERRHLVEDEARSQHLLEMKPLRFTRNTYTT